MLVQHARGLHGQVFDAQRGNESVPRKNANKPRSRERITPDNVVNVVGVHGLQDAGGGSEPVLQVELAEVFTRVTNQHGQGFQ